MIQSIAVTQASFCHAASRRLLHQTAALATTVAALLFVHAIDAQPVSADQSKRPNIVLIMADDLGWAELGCYGQTKIKTPHLDRLAVDGVRFTQFYTGAPVCAPARCSLMTGRHGGHALVRDNFEVRPSKFDDKFGGQYPLPAGSVTIASILKAQGYATGAFGKWGLGGVGTSGDPLHQGFDRYFGFNCQRHAHNLYPRYLVDNASQRILDGNTRGRTGKQYGPQIVADEMLAFIRENKNRPFFVYYPTVIPHLALQAPEEDIAAYRKNKWPETPYDGKRYVSHKTPKACYAAMISFLDKQVGRLMALLKELQLDESTIVLFTSDNGTTSLREQVDYVFFNSVGPLRGLKGSVYEGGLRVPMIVRWPGHIPAGITTDHVAANYDSLATICDLVGIEPPADGDGVSYLPTLLNEPDRQKKHDYLFWDFAGYGGQLAVRAGDWKGVRRNLRRNPAAPLQLYNLADDIGEKTNVAAEHPEIAGRISNIMRQARTEPPVPQFRFGQYGRTKNQDDRYAWQDLFDGKSLKNWTVTKFGGEGNVAVKEGTVVMATGNDMTGITYSGKPPRTNYEITLEGMRVDGSDFFCTTTFPVGDQSCSFVVGGWGGTVVGLSSVNRRDASENETARFFSFKDQKWYRIRIRVTDTVVACWIGDEQVVNIPRKDNTFDIRMEVELNKPLGISTWQTTGAVRNIRLRLLKPSEASGATEKPAAQRPVAEKPAAKQTDDQKK